MIQHCIPAGKHQHPAHLPLLPKELQQSFPPTAGPHCHLSKCSAATCTVRLLHALAGLQLTSVYVHQLHIHSVHSTNYVRVVIQKNFFCHQFELQPTSVVSSCLGNPAMHTLLNFQTYVDQYVGTLTDTHGSPSLPARPLSW